MTTAPESRKAIDFSKINIPTKLSTTAMEANLKLSLIPVTEFRRVRREVFAPWNEHIISELNTKEKGTVMLYYLTANGFGPAMQSFPTMDEIKNETKVADDVDALEQYVITRTNPTSTVNSVMKLLNWAVPSGKPTSVQQVFDMAMVAWNEIPEEIRPVPTPKPDASKETKELHADMVRRLGVLQVALVIFPRKPIGNS